VPSESSDHRAPLFAGFLGWALDAKDDKAQAAEILGIGRTTLVRFPAENEVLAENKAMHKEAQ
jgi:hypothetical protein